MPEHTSPLVSVVIPVFNEATTLADLHQRLARTLKDHGAPWEVIFVDDGSRDGSWKVIEELAGGDERVKAIGFRRNFGKSPALHMGFEKAQGEVVITMDADLQCDPAEIPLLIAPLEQGYDFVSGVRKGRRDPRSRQVWSRLLTRIVTSITRVRLQDVGCPFNACTADVVHAVSTFGELRRFLKPLAVRAVDGKPNSVDRWQLGDGGGRQRREGGDVDVATCEASDGAFARAHERFAWRRWMDACTAKTSNGKWRGNDWHRDMDAVTQSQHFCALFFFFVGLMP